MGFLSDLIAPILTLGAMFVAGPAVLGLSTIGQIAFTFAVSTIASRIFAPNVPQIQNNNVRLQVPPDPTAGIPLVYGNAYTGGRFVDAVLSTDQQTMYYVMVVSCISPNGQFTFDTGNCYYGDQKIAFSGTSVTSLTDGQGNISTTINGNLDIFLYTSSASGVITGVNTSSLPSSVMGGSDIASAYRWASSNRQMNGTAFAIVKLKYNQSAGTTQLSPITFKVSHYLNSQGCALPGDVWYDYLTNNVYGGAMSTTLVDSNSATALNNYSNELITYTDTSGNPASCPRYRFNGVLDTGQTVLSNIDIMMNCCDSWMQYNAASGKWAIVINQQTSATNSFDDTNIIGNITLGSVDLNQAINQVEAQYNDATNRDQAGYVNIKTPSYLLYPNEPTNKFTINYALINDNVRAQYLANRVLEQNREDLTISFNTTYVGIQVNAGDVVTVTNAAYGWNNKKFRVMQVKEASLPDGTLGASLQMIEYSDGVYANADITQYQPVPNTGLPAISYFSSLTASTVTDQQQTATIPSFSVVTTIPTTGRVTTVQLFYTTNPTPSTSDWQLLGIQNSPDLTPYNNGATLKFTNISLPTGTYYFAYRVGNSVGLSGLSPQSISFAWLPNPTTSAVAGTFIATFSPATIQVPYVSGSTIFTGIHPQLYGTTSGGSVDFVASQTDSDSAFVNNSWRIGSSATTGYSDIVATGISIGNPTDAGNYALFPEPTTMPVSIATLSVPVRYKDSFGTVKQGANAILQFAYSYQGSTGAAGNKTATVSLYQWSTTLPNNPNGTSTYTWATGANSSYTGGNSWSTTIPNNPGTPNIQLWSATKAINAPSSDVTTSVDWTSGYSIQSIGQNGATGTTGIQSAIATVYQWSITTPTGPTGTATYTWATGAFGSAPSGWSLTIGTSPSVGYTLYSASVKLLDSASATTTAFNWSTSTISAISYAGSNGISGSSSRVAYAVVTGSTLNTTPTTYTTTGGTSFPPTNTWGGSETWQGTVPSYSAGQSIFQSDGIFDPTTGNTVWNVPYISALKVGSLSAITTNTGTLNVSGTISSANGNFSVDSSGNVTIRNATTGARLTISNNVIKVYDSTGVLRVQLGDLTA